MTNFDYALHVSYEYYFEDDSIEKLLDERGASDLLKKMVAAYRSYTGDGTKDCIDGFVGGDFFVQLAKKWEKEALTNDKGVIERVQNGDVFVIHEAGKRYNLSPELKTSIETACYEHDPNNMPHSIIIEKPFEYDVEVHWYDIGEEKAVRNLIINIGYNTSYVTLKEHEHSLLRQIGLPNKKKKVRL